jgi:serine phosphatase RsbU (regulator of sigma subunit)
VSIGDRVLRDGFVTVVDGLYSGIGTGFSLMQAMSDLETHKTRQLLASIDYASTIQQAHLRDSWTHLSQAFDDHHMAWEPRDGVGGDCFFVRRFDQGALVVIIDCTGHGVPGAFMTLIGLSWLEQQARQSAPSDDPRFWLTGLHQHVQNVLGQSQGAENSGRRTDDGMDCAVLWVPEGGRHVRFASARLSLLLTPPGAVEVVTVAGDKLGLGYGSTPADTPWTLQEIPLDKPHRLLVVTDGVIDQIGGPRAIAHGKRRLVDFMRDRSMLTARQLGPILSTHLCDWQGPHRRRDDVTFFTCTLGA